MKNKRSARLGFVAAIWLVLSIAVFGTLIGIAWMSMNATAEVSADAFVVDSVDLSTLAIAPIVDCVDRAPMVDCVDRAPMVDCVDRAPIVDCVDRDFEDVIVGYRNGVYISVERRVSPPVYPIAPGYMLERWVGPSENPIAPGYMLERWVGPSENPIAPGYLLDS
ncbi:MAG: hypothetical protein RTS72_00885 [Candidatus Thorarchaeota archaeon]